MWNVGNHAPADPPHDHITMPGKASGRPWWPSTMIIHVPMVWMHCHTLFGDGAMRGSAGRCVTLPDDGAVRGNAGTHEGCPDKRSAMIGIDGHGTHGATMPAIVLHCLQRS